MLSQGFNLFILAPSSFSSNGSPPDDKDCHGNHSNSAINPPPVLIPEFLDLFSSGLFFHRLNGRLHKVQHLGMVFHKIL
jgi:hypothetical protein